MATPRKLLWLCAVLILTACAIRLYQIDLQSIWFDEGWSAYAAVQPSLSDAFQADATNPPLYYVLLNIAAHLWGDSVFALRFFSLLNSLIIVSLASRLAASLYGSQAGVFAAVLAATNPLLWWASQEARMYTLLAVLVLIMALAWHRLRKVPSLWAWLVLWAGELALLYAHNTGPVAALWINAAMVLAWILHRPARKLWAVWVMGQAGVFLLWLPYLLTRFLLLQGANNAVTSAPSLDFTLVWNIWQAFWVGVWALIGRAPLLTGWSLLTGILAVVVIPWWASSGRWMMFHVVALTSGLVIGLVVLGNELHGRYLVMIVPLLLVALAGGLERLPQRMGWGLVTIPVLALPLSMAVFYQTPGAMHDDTQSMVAYYSETLTARDSVVAWSYADRYELAYYWDRLGVQARRITLPEGADLDQVLPLLPSSGDVALNVWYTQRADYRGMLGCILGNGTREEPERFTVNGMSNLLYRAPDLQLPDLQQVSLSLRGADLSAVGVLPASGASDQAACVPISIRLRETPNVDLKAALTVRNMLGWEIARGDAIFAQAAQQTSSGSEAGAELTAYPLLRLPAGTPAGVYPVYLRVYDEALEPSGYDLSAGEGLVGKDWLIGEWRTDENGAWTGASATDDLPEMEVVDYQGLRLTAADLGYETVRRNGETVRLTLLWAGEGALPVLRLEAEDGSWHSEAAAAVSEVSGTLTRDWRDLTIPREVGRGRANLLLPDGQILASYTIDALERQFEPFNSDREVLIEFADVGTLVGYSVSQLSLDRTLPVEVHLVWRGKDATQARDYTVFVQLLNENGVLIAQSDSPPAGGSRPTSGWVEGEYIEDVHLLTFNENRTEGRAQLIVGLYDSTGERIVLQDGSTYATLDSALQIP